MKVADLIVKRVARQLSTGEYSIIRQAYEMTIKGVMTEYLYTPGAKISKYKNAFKQAIQEAFYPSFEMGLVDGGGQAPAEGDDLAWINARAEQEWGFVDALFDQLKTLKTQGEEAYRDEPARRAAGYAKTLDGVYNEGKLRGGKDPMLTFSGEDGAESCATCQKWKGKTHRASFWIKRGLVPGQPGNPSFECRGYNCQHFLFNAKNGEVFTI